LILAEDQTGGFRITAPSADQRKMAVVQSLARRYRNALARLAREDQ
jgi:hypothetical protein